MSGKKLSVLLAVAVMVAAAAISSADAGVGGCRNPAWCGGGGGFESAAIQPAQSRTSDLISSLGWFLPRTVVESLNAVVTRIGSADKPATLPKGGATVEGVGGCFVGCGTGHGWL